LAWSAVLALTTSRHFPLLRLIIVRPPVTDLVFAGEGIWPTGETNELDNRIIGKAAASLTSGV